MTHTDDAEGARVGRLVTRGVIHVDGRDVALENNVWLVGDANEVIVIDPAHDPEATLAAVDGRLVTTILITHGHADHAGAALRFAELVDAPVFLHPADLELWSESHPDRQPDGVLVDEAVFTVRETPIRVLHTPGHTPGSVSFLAPTLGAVFTGDTLFEGGPGATRWSYSSFPVIVDSIRTRLFTLPPQTVVHPGHGRSTTIGAERPQLAQWLARGW
ncbi:MAG TPA: MBL fold metallo-hydrolase [Microbacteriaceae bacterium]|nr:MBL fold metallo-hydrolase [Microbacteriaceae bacterium]